jgi:selenide,water dikinase
VRARKYKKAGDDLLAGAIRSMLELNDGIAPVVEALGDGAIHACTDVTGFGLVGHASEMASASGVTLVVDADRLPVLPGALDLVSEFLPCGGRANMRHFRALDVADGVATARHLIALDPQTSGGLLLSVDPTRADELLGLLSSRLASACAIGRVEPAGEQGARVRLV